MLILGDDGQQLELKILGYQYPTHFDNEWDANWLRLYINVKSNLGHWQTVDPSLTSWEIKRVIEWFNNLSQDKLELPNEVEFIEPNLFFQNIGKIEGLKIIQIKFGLELKPQSADDSTEYFINFNLSNKELARISDDLEKEYKNFPIRTFP